MKKEYVVGFAYDLITKTIVLIEKQKPEWQAGLFNGIGGKVEPTDESLHNAMCREFIEETGVPTTCYDWRYFCKMEGDESIVHCFSSYKINIFDCKTMETERVVFWDLENLPKNCVPNLNWLVPMARYLHNSDIPAHVIMAKDCRG